MRSLWETMVRQWLGQTSREPPDLNSNLPDFLKADTAGIGFAVRRASAAVDRADRPDPAPAIEQPLVDSIPE